MTTRPSNLREELASAVRQRKNAIQKGWSKRKDVDRVNAAIVAAEMFLRSYPVADDQRVRQWCKANAGLVDLIVIGTNQRQLSRLLMDELRPTKNSDAA